MIERDVEEALDLASMQVDAEHTVHTRRDKQIRYKLRGDWGAWRDLAVLTAIAVVRNHSGDAVSRCTPQSVAHDEQFNEVVVDRGARRLDHKAVETSNAVVELAEGLAVAEATDGRA